MKFSILKDYQVMKGHHQSRYCGCNSITVLILLNILLMIIFALLGLSGRLALDVVGHSLVQYRSSYKMVAAVRNALIGELLQCSWAPLTCMALQPTWMRIMQGYCIMTSVLEILLSISMGKGGSLTGICQSQCRCNQKLLDVQHKLCMPMFHPVL